MTLFKKETSSSKIQAQKPQPNPPNQTSNPPNQGHMKQPTLLNAVLGQNGLNHSQTSRNTLNNHRTTPLNHHQTSQNPLNNLQTSQYPLNTLQTNKNSLNGNLEIRNGSSIPRKAGSKKQEKQAKRKNGATSVNGSAGAIKSPAVASVQDMKPYHWQSDGKKSTVEDMVLLPKISESAITDNLKKRLSEDRIYTYIGPVLVAVNPFKQLPYFGERELQMYQGASHCEVPPHVYAVADNMYRNMLSDSESQCVIISGESGAGKTVSAKYIMNYITRTSGGGPHVQKVKEVIMESNPLLEAFGNAKTIRNNNSSRFGKYIEIEFSRGGVPQGGKISNFLLEKSRVHFLNEGERNFHIFYQLCTSSDENLRTELGLTNPDYYNYLNLSGVYDAEGTDDSKEFYETLKAMEVMGIEEDTKMDILRVVAAILHMGNITFVENDNRGQIADLNFLEFPAFLLGVDPESLNQKLTSRVFDSKWGSVSERVDMVLNVEQAQFARDAWAKGLYSRLFDYIVQRVNTAMETKSQEMNLGILDIYGFEIFGRNGFEQFCINYVNEKLQQIFIELTLKLEQEEYREEGIQWKPIEFFNNKIVCDLIESKRPPGIFSILDDTVATMSAVSEGADIDFRNKMNSQVGSNAHYLPFKDGFTVRHYAGKVDYHIDGFCEKNRDVLFVDIIEVMKNSSNAFIRALFPENTSTSIKSRPTTVAAKIRTQANSLVTRLSSCVPHYIRCIKPNETKKPKDWEDSRVKEQVEYLGLKENIKVKRAGFSYRRPFEKFLHRYEILCPESLGALLQDPKKGIHTVMRCANMDSSQYQLGVTKCFIKDPESLYMLEELRERKFDFYARIIQKAFRKHFSSHKYAKDREEACNVLLNRKQRRENSINRNFYGDSIGLDFRPNLRKLVPKREKVEFAETIMKYDRRFRPSKRHLVLTKSAIFLLGLTKIKKGPQKGQVVDVVKRKIELERIIQVFLSCLADNFVLISVRDDFETLLEINLKTEFLMMLNRKYFETCQRELPRNFVNSFEYQVKKTFFGRSGTRKVEFSEGTSPSPTLSSFGTILHVKMGPHLPPGTRSSARKITPEVRMYALKYNNNNTVSNRTSNGNLRPNIHKNHVGPSNHETTNARNVSRDGSKAVPNFVGSQPPLRLPTANERWPPTSQQQAHIVPPPPSQPAPANQPVVPRKPPLLKPKPKLNQVRALYDYDARDHDELTFVEGNVMELIKEDPSGWWVCRFKGKEGFCPGNYVEKI